MPCVSDLQGLWTRSLIRWPDGASDTTTSVRWLQGVSAYIDLRQPVPMPSFSHAAGLNDLTMEDCLVLAMQEGFAGHFSYDGSFFEWARTIDYQPRALYSDAGALWWDGDVLVEKGRDIEYIEHWHRDATLSARHVAALTLRCAETGVSGGFLRVGNHFMFARDRTVTPTERKHLSDCVAAAAEVMAARALVDCEISFGMVTAAGYRISASTLPYRVGDALDEVFAPHSLTIDDRAPDGRMVRRRWEITGTEGENIFEPAATQAI